MNKTSLRARALACALLGGTALCGIAASPAAAQPPSPTFRNLDSNGVDLVLGDFVTSFPEGSIGSGEAELALLRMVGAIGGSPWYSGNQWDNILLEVGSSSTSVKFGSRSDTFPGAESRGVALLGSGDSRQYRSPDGTIIAFTDPNAGNSDITNFCDTSGTQAGCILVPTSIASPDGKVVTLEWEFWSYCPERQNFEDPTNCHYTPRLARVSNSYGYSIAFAYAAAAGQGGGNPPSGFYQRTGATFHNSHAGSSALASVSYSYPSTGVVEITDTGGRVWRATSGPSAYSVRRPGASADSLSASLSGGVVTSAVKDGVATTYSRSVSGNVATMIVTNALSQASTVVSNLTTGRPTSVTDPLNRTTAFAYDSSGRLTRTTAPEGNYVEHVYDSRGNVIQTTAVPKGGSGATIVTSASFDSTCGNPVKCNQPNNTTDARGNVTHYEYDSTHGGVTKIISPAPTTGAVAPETRFSYTLANGEIRLTGISQCRTTASCAGTADEVKTVIAYNPDGSVYWTATGNGTGTLVAASTMTYDAIGNLRTVDGPLSESADTVQFRYNAARQLVGTVSPDPDGAGNLKPRAVRNSYDSLTGLLTRVEQGNVNSQSDSDWALFTPALAAETVYDSNARPVASKLVSGSTVYSLTQTSYDALGRPECVAQRMDSADFASNLPGACALTTPAGGEGPDRISKTIYDAAGQVSQTKTALGTADEATETSLTYTSNGKVQTVTDAEGNRTTYEYDGHDRLSKTYYPMPTKGAAASNASDYEQLTYESLAGGTHTSGVVAAFRNRANQSIGFGYDALGRVTSKDRPGSESDLTYGYDLLGQLVSASQTGHSLSLTYDALGRQLTETGPLGTMTSEYDLAGRRTKLTWPDTFHVTYDHLVTGETTAIRENGATSGIGVLATFGYDPLTVAGQLGQRTSLTRGNGVVTSYAYDPASRLQQLKLDMDGTATANDLTLDFTYNPANQIASTTRSNDLYAFTGHGSGTTSTTSNGLNQIASWVNALGYDSKGNVTGNGTYSFTYSSENLLTSLTNTASGAVQSSSTYAYDPLMRLARIDSSNSALDADLGYDGQEIVLEGLSSARTRRYVFGPGVDEPLVAYLVTSTGTTRSWYAADERGSTIRQSNDSGNVAGGIGKYDEYGVGLGTSRFQYTGQYWLGDAGLHYYRARVYDPKLGRFLQPDPIGYGAGMNMYAYVSGDPVNFTDPSGLCGVGEVPLARARTHRPDGDVVAKYRFFCVKLFNNEDNDESISDFGEAGPINDAEVVDASLLKLLPKICVGPARVLRGNDGFIGLKGAYGTKITVGSAAVVARQFGSTTTAPDEDLKDVAPLIFGKTESGQWFFGITDNIDHKQLDPKGTTAKRQQMIMDRDRGRLLIEIMGGQDRYEMVAVVMPAGRDCPANTQ